MADLGGEALVAQHERRVGQADGGLGDVLHLDEHVDGAVEVGERAVLGRRRRLPRRRRRQLPQAVDAGRRAPEEEHVAGRAQRVAVDVGDPLAARGGWPRPACRVCTGSSRSDSGRRARWLFSRTRTRCETSSALERSATSSRGMPRRWVTMRAMSTAALAMRSMDEITWSTDAISSASFGWRAASTHTARMSCTSSLMRSSSSPTSSAMPGSPKYERGVGEVDHQLGGVLGLGEHRPQVAFPFFHGMVSSERVATTMPRSGDGDDEGEGADEVDRARHHRDAVGVGVEAGAEGDDRAVVGDDDDEGHGDGAGRAAASSTISPSPGLRSPSSVGRRSGRRRR